MTSNHNKQKKLDSNSSYNQPSVSPTEDQTTTIKAKPQSKSIKAEVKQNSNNHGGKLGVIAILISLAFGGGLTYKLVNQQAVFQKQQTDYITRITNLETQLKTTQNSIQEKLQKNKDEVKKLSDNIEERTHTSLKQQQESISSLQQAITSVNGAQPKTDGWRLAEADYLVKLAGRKLYLEHNVASATQLMKDADQSIAALNDPSLIDLRQKIADDIVQLKMLPLIKHEDMILKLTALQQQVDTLPLAQPILAKEETKERKILTEDISNWQENLKASLKGFADNFITIRTSDESTAPLLPPKQHFYLKENLKAKLGVAIQAIYQEQNGIYQASLQTANDWVANFFNENESSVKDFRKELNLLQQQNLQVQYPSELKSHQALNSIISNRLQRGIASMTNSEGQ
ncbi:uroporphyrinogen-III C-methyltransferase [Vibrio sagamiensis]|uniref:Heme biosynthesis operon protein HemX n=1 Tax=Vibrio sagamiensis NBRC 104589 TaxID=1219064 RepID=A0A511QHY5_9VIBR|nr:uroporphyrinogen-III C-methyltransferase [Vibrio sagamiensis]PNQ68356.1 heme biosynthesis operon protein HemX [Vibrio agarivorans]GEM76901.1 heme biosynthesis operon protein HemX [Vibrio sagamiensis NBRC 104589]